MKKCTNCGGQATKQTVKGKQNEKAGGLPINDGWYCDLCWEVGMELEREAMYWGDTPW